MSFYPLVTITWIRCVFKSPWSGSFGSPVAIIIIIEIFTLRCISVSRRRIENELPFKNWDDVLHFSFLCAPVQNQYFWGHRNPFMFSVCSALCAGYTLYQIFGTGSKMYSTFSIKWQINKIELSPNSVALFALKWLTRYCLANYL